MDMDSVAKTSLMTAAMRAVESKRSESQGRLFVDPYAEILAGEEGFSLLQKAVEASGEQPAIAVRTSFMDQKIKEHLKKGTRQLVILAAGMDTRSYRLDFPSDLHVFELDRKEVLDYKELKLKDEKPKCARTLLSVDLREEWHHQLHKAGFRPGLRTLWLVEGLLMYLHEPQVETLFRRIEALANENDVLLTDILGQTLLDSPFMQNQLSFLSSIGAPWHFGTNDPEGFLRKFGWEAKATQPGEFASQRWPFPTPPRGVPNVPRSFFVEAHLARPKLSRL